MYQQACHVIACTLGLRQLCRHNFEHNRHATESIKHNATIIGKPSSIMGDGFYYFYKKDRYTLIGQSDIL